MSKRVSYRAALDWIAANDDCEWAFEPEPIISVTAAMVRDLWGQPTEILFEDIRKAYHKMYPRTAEGFEADLKAKLK